MRLILSFIVAALFPSHVGAFNGEQAGPLKGKIGDVAELEIPAYYTWIDQGSAGQFMKDLGNHPSGRELGAIIGGDGRDRWFGLFEFDDIGFIKDASSEKLDADALLQSIKDGNEAANDERRKNGEETIDVVGWGKPPFYNPDTQRLEWSVIGRQGGVDIVNYKTRILGRNGAMSVLLVCENASLDRVLPDFQKRLEGFNYVAGHKYAEWKEGDKVAAIGLAALVLGGVAAKTGLLAKFAKFLVYGLKYLWKLVIVIIAMIGAAIKKFIEWMSGKDEKKNREGYVPQSTSAHKAPSPGDVAASANGAPDPPKRVSEAQPSMDDPKT